MTVFGLLGALAVGLFALIGAARLAMLSVRERLLASFRESTGYDISYRAISPAFFRYVEIRGLTVSSREPGRRVILSVRDIRVHYDLLAFLFAKDKLRAVVKIEIEDGKAAIDAQRDRSLIVFLQGILKSPSEEYRLSDRFSLSGSNVNFVYREGETEYAVRRLFASVKTDDRYLNFSLNTRGEAAAASTADIAASDAVRGPDLTASLDMNGRVDRSFSLLDADFRVESLQAGGVILKEQQFHIGLKDRQLEITKVQDRSPLDLSLRYGLDSGVIEAGFLAEDLAPASLVDVTDKLEDLRPLLASRVSADGTLRYDVPRNDLEFGLTLDGYVPETVSPIAVRLHSRIEGTEERIEFAPLALASTVGRAEFTGNVLFKTTLPEGRLTLADVKTSLGDDLNADLAVARSDRSVTLTGEKVTIGSAGFRSFLLDVFPGRGELRFALASTLDLPVKDNSLTLSGSLSYDHGNRLSLEGTLASIPLNFPYRALVKAEQYSESLDRSLQPVLWTTRFSFNTDFQSYLFRAPDIVLSDSLNVANRLVFSVEASEDELRISPLRGGWAGYALAADADVRWRKKAGFDFTAGVSVDGEKYSFDGRFIPGSGVIVSGTNGFSFMLAPQPGGGQYLALQVTSLPVPLSGQRVFATLDWIGSLSAAGDLFLVSRRTRIDGIPRLIPGMEAASADLRFSLSGGRLQIAEVEYRDKVSALAGNGSFDLAFAPEPRTSGWLYLADENKVENYTAVVNLSPERSEVTLFFENSPLAHWGEVPVNGSLSGKLVMRGPLSDPAFDVTAALGHGRLNGESVTLAADFTLSSAGFTLKSLEGSYSRNLKIFAGSGGFDSRTGAVDFTAVVAAGIRPVHADLAFKASIHDYDKTETPAEMLNRRFSGNLAVVNKDAKQGESGRWEIDFFSDKEGFYISGGPDDVLMGQMRRDGSFRFDLSPPFPLQGHFEGRLADNRIDARAEGLAVHLPALNELVNTPFFVIRDGIVRGDLSITGPAIDPDFSGVLTVENLSASSSALAEPIGPLSSVLDIRDKMVVVRQTQTKAGNAPISVYAEMVLDHWNISRLTTRLVIDDPVGVRLTLPVDILAVDGYVTTPGLALTVDQSGVAIDGSLFVQKCDVVLGTAEAEPETDDVQSNLVVNLDLKTGKQVEIYWPARAFPILRMVTEPGARLAVKYNQLKDEFSLNGDINFKGGEVYYFERNFLIREGSLSLRETQLDFNPLLNLKAERRIRYDDKDVKITMSVPNQRLKEFAPVFDTDPPLPITERYLALGGVIQPPETGNNGEYLTSIVGDIGGDVLTQLVLLHPLEQKMKQLLNLDGFSIRTQFISNLILDTVFNNDQNLAPDAPVSMGRYLNNTEITFQKYLDEKNNLFFETIVRIRADLAHANGSTLSQAFGNVNVESEFSLELTTPFFLTIKWSITPEHWETFFLPDNKITFKWGMSF